MADLGAEEEVNCLEIREELMKTQRDINVWTLSLVKLRKLYNGDRAEGSVGEESLLSMENDIKAKEDYNEVMKAQATALGEAVKFYELRAVKSGSQAGDSENKKENGSSSNVKSDYNTRIKKDDLPKLSKEMGVGKVMKWKSQMSKIVKNRSFTSDGIKAMLGDSLSEAIMGEITMAEVWSRDLEYEELANEILKITLGDFWAYKVEEFLDTFELGLKEKFFSFCLRFEQYVSVMGRNLQEVYLGACAIEKVKRKLPKEVLTFMFEKEQILPFSRVWTWEEFKKKLRDLDNNVEFRNWKGLKGLLNEKKPMPDKIPEVQKKKKKGKKEEKKKTPNAPPPFVYTPSPF